MADIVYTGRELIWSPKGENVTYTFNATSGLYDGLADYRFVTEQCLQGAGPLPRGTYVLSLEIDSKPAQDDGMCNLIPSSKIQTIPQVTQRRLLLQVKYESVSTYGETDK